MNYHDQLTNWMKLMESAYELPPAIIFDHREDPAELIPLMNQAFRAAGTEYELRFGDNNILFLYNSDSNDDKRPIHFNPQSYPHTFVEQVSTAVAQHSNGDWFFEHLRTGNDEYLYVFRIADRPVAEGDIEALIQSAIKGPR